MKRIFRSLSLILIPLALAILFSACAQNKIESGYLVIDGKETTPEWIVKLDGESVGFAEYRHFYLNAKTDLDAGDSAYFSRHPELEATLKETTLDYLKQCYAVTFLAREHGISLTSEEKDAVKAEIASLKNDYGDQLYAELLEGYYLTEDLYYKSKEDNALYEKVYQTLVASGGELNVDEDALAAYITENYYCYAQIYLDFKSGEGTNTHPATQAAIESAYERLKAGEDFWKVAFSASDDMTMFDYKNGYLRLKSECSEALSEALDTLADHEYSEPVLDNDGYYILLKLPIGKEVTEENRLYLLSGYDEANGTHVNGLYEDRFAELVRARADAILIEYADCYEAIGTATLF